MAWDLVDRGSSRCWSLFSGLKSLKRLPEIRFNDIGMGNHFLRRSLKKFASEVEYEDAIRQRQDDAEEIFNHQDLHDEIHHAFDSIHNRVDLRTGQARHYLVEQKQF